MSYIYNCTGHKIRLPNIVDSSGVYVIDSEGRRYMDLESGVWCTALGHNNPRVGRAMKRQIDTVVHAGFSYSAPVVEDAAASILEITGLTGGRCVFLSSGSEAVELARQTSRLLTGKKKSMTLHDSYLGSYSSVIDREDGWHIFNWSRCIDCPSATEPGVDCEEVRRIPEDVSEFIFEPGSSSGFVRFPPKTLVENIVRVVRANGGKVVANEVTTGVGRTGYWFGYQHYDLEPDIVAVGKGIGNGYPVSVTAFSPQISADLEPSPFHYMQSHQNDPLGAAVVDEVIRIVTESDLVTKAADKGRVFAGQLQSLVDGTIITGFRGRGLMFAIDLRDQATGDQIFERLLERGYIIGNRDSLFRIDPPLTITEAEFTRFAEDFKAILS